MNTREDALFELQRLNARREALVTKREGMVAENACRASRGEYMVYGEQAFADIAEDLLALARLP